MTPEGGRPRRHGLLLVGGLVGLLAPSVARSVHSRVVARLAAGRGHGDPVEPFRAAPCYRRPPDASPEPAESRTRTAP